MRVSLLLFKYSLLGGGGGICIFKFLSGLEQFSNLRSSTVGLKNVYAERNVPIAQLEDC